MPSKLSKNRIKYLTSLRQKKYRQREQKCLVEGSRLCEEAIKSDLVETLFITQQFADSECGTRLIAKAQDRAIEMIEVLSADLNKFTNTVHSQGVCALMRIPSPTPFPTNWRDPTVLLALDTISDPGNLGTIIRTADWFAADAILLGHGCVELYNPKVMRSTMGSAFHLPIYEGIDLVQELSRLKNQELRICAGDAHAGTPVGNFEWPSKMMLLIGSESRGINHQLQGFVDELVHIPKLGGAESLNAATATGILLFAIQSQSNPSVTGAASGHQSPAWPACCPPASGMAGR